MENVIERMQRIGADEKIKSFMAKEKLPYEVKVKYAAIRAREFVEECGKRNLNYHVSVGGLDSIVLWYFLRSLKIDAPGVSVSSLEDVSIQRVHDMMGIIKLKPAKRPDGTYWTKQKILQEKGFPVLSKEIASKINLLANPTEKTKQSGTQSLQEKREHMADIRKTAE